MTRGELVGQLKSQSTWRLVFLSLITFGIYSAHYIKRQTSRLNQHLDAERRISEGLIKTILISSYVSAVFALASSILVGEGLELVSEVTNVGWLLLTIFWSFMARDRLNSLLALTEHDPDWFHALYALLFTNFYINFKINTLNEIFVGRES